VNLINFSPAGRSGRAIRIQTRKDRCEPKPKREIVSASSSLARARLPSLRRRLEKLTSSPYEPHHSASSVCALKKSSSFELGTRILSVLSVGFVGGLNLERSEGEDERDDEEERNEGRSRWEGAGTSPPGRRRHRGRGGAGAVGKSEGGGAKEGRPVS